MNELQRQAYLSAMGVDVYYPRLGLPGAKPSELCEMPDIPKVARSVENAGRVLEAKDGDNSRAPINVSELLDVPAKARPSEVVRPVKAPAIDQNTPSFNLSVTHIQGNLLVVDECSPEILISSDYRQLLQNVVFALGLGKQPINSQPFQWPEAMKGHSQQGVEVAKEALQSYLARQLELSGAGYLLLMGEAAIKFAVNAELAEGILTPHVHVPVQMLATLSVSRMLSEPELKRELWQQLQPVYRALNQP